MPRRKTTYAWVGTPGASASTKTVGGVEVARNLFAQPSLAESGIASGGSNPPVVEYGVTPPEPLPVDGGPVAKVTMTHVGAAGFAQGNIKTVSVSIPREVVHTFSVWVYGGGDWLYIYPTGSHGIARMGRVEGDVSGSGWARYALTAAVPPHSSGSTAAMAIYVYLTSSIPEPRSFYIARAMLDQADTLTPYFDGDTPAELGLAVAMPDGSERDVTSLRVLRPDGSEAATQYGVQLP